MPDEASNPLHLPEEELRDIWHNKFGNYDENITVSISRDACRKGLTAWAERSHFSPDHVSAMMAEIEAAMRTQAQTDQPPDPSTHSAVDDHPMETGVLRALAGAYDDLVSARKATAYGFVSDHCDNALAEIRKAMRLVIGDR